MSKLKVQMFVIIFLFITGYIPIPIGSPIVIAGNGVGQGIRGLNEENRLLEVEIGLAQEKKSYLILNPSTKKIYLKNGGFTMREFDIAKIRYWRERGQTIEPIILVKKRALFYPKRKEIKPSKKEGGTDTTTHTETDFLELGDMPYRYTLLFEKGVSISVAGRSEGGVISGFIGSIDSVLKHIRHSFATVWNYLRKRDFAIVDLVMSKEDVQSFFWVLEEGTNIVIVGVPQI